MNVSFLAPLGFALGLTLPVVVVFYLLKVRRRDEEISSTFLWADLLRDLAAHEPLQRLRWNVLLVMQLLALTLVTVAVARPYTEQVGQTPVQAILLVDGSASMQSADSQPSRFARAVEAARSTLTTLPDNSLATAILIGAHPQVLVSATADRHQVDRALADARPTASGADMRESLLLARSLGGDPASRRIFLFTDAAFTLPPDLPDDLGAVQVVPVASSASGNVAVTAISTRPDPRDNRRQQVFARVANFSDTPTHTEVTLTVDGQPTDERSLDLDANGHAEQVFDDVTAGAHWASVTLTRVSGKNDLALDDTAFVVLSQRKPAQVLLVSSGNHFLEKVLTLLPNVDLYRIPAQRYLAVEADRFDIVVFDNYGPPLLPRGNLLVVNPPDHGPFRTTGQVRRPRVGSWERDDPVLAFADVRDLTVNVASRLDMPRWAKPLVSTTDGMPLLAAGQDGDRRVALIPFDLQQSNLPLMSAFPILMANLVGYLSPPGIVLEPAIQTGAPVSLAPLPQVEQVRVTSPSDTSMTFRAGQGPITYAATDTPGLYRVQQVVQRGQQTVDDDLFAANLTSPDESDIRPRLSGLDSPPPVDAGLAILRREFWLVLAALALPLVLVEWLWFHRRL